MRSGSINTMSSDAGLDIMSTINSSDIENITIIKDAAAALSTVHVLPMV